MTSSTNHLRMNIDIDDCDCNDDINNDDTNSHDWLDCSTVTNRSVVLRTAIASPSPWNHHPLLLDDVDMEDDNTTNDCDTNYNFNNYNNYNYYETQGGTGSAKPRVSLDVTETWMTMTDEQAAPFDFMVMEGLESDPILTGGDVVDTAVTTPTSPQLSLPLQVHSSFLQDDMDPWRAAGIYVDIEDDCLMMDHDDDHHHGCNNSIGGGEDEGTACGGAADCTATTTTTESSTDSSFASHYHGTPRTSTTSPPPAESTLNSWQFQERRAQLATSMRMSQLSRQCLSMKDHVRTRANLQQVLADIEKSTVAVQQHCLIMHGECECDEQEDSSSSSISDDEPCVPEETASSLSTKQEPEEQQPAL